MTYVFSCWILHDDYGICISFLSIWISKRFIDSFCNLTLQVIANYQWTCMIPHSKWRPVKQWTRSNQCRIQWKLKKTKELRLLESKGHNIWSQNFSSYMLFLSDILLYCGIIRNEKFQNIRLFFRTFIDVKTSYKTLPRKNQIFKSVVYIFVVILVVEWALYVKY